MKTRSISFCIIIYLLSIVNASAQDVFNAVTANDLIQVKSLVDHNPTTVKDMDSSGNTPLHLAAQAGYKEIVRYLINHGADPNSVNRFDFTPLHYATQNNKIDLAEYLISQGADINRVLLDSYYGYTALTFSIMNDNPKMLIMLHNRGGNIHHCTQLEENYLHFAAAFNRIEIAKYLIECGIDVNSTKSGGLTPLHIAAIIGNKEVAKYLISEGADIDIRSEDQGTALHYALAAKNHEITKLLRASGAKDLPRDFPEYRGRYLGQKLPGKEPEPFLPELFRVIYRSYSVPVFSPDGKELFWYGYFMPWIGYSRIWWMREENGKWTAPELAPFSDYRSWGPSFSPDGQRLYFASSKPSGDSTRTDSDIWYVEKLKNGWSEPVNAGSPPNRVDYNEIRPLVSKDGTLYFIAFGPESGGTLFYKSDFSEGVYQAPQPLDDFIGTGIVDDCREMKSLILYSYFGQKYAEISICFHKPDGSWTSPVYMDDIVHRGHGTSQGLLSQDGKYLFFNQDISPYWIDATFIKDLHREALKEEK